MRIDFSLVQLRWFFVCVYFGFFSLFCPKLRGFTFWLDEYLPKFGNFGGRQTQTVVVANKSLCTNHSSRMRVLVQLWHITLVRAIHANNKCFVVSFPRLAPKLNVLEVEEALLLPSTHILANTRGKIPPSRQKILCPVQGLTWRV